MLIAYGSPKKENQMADSINSVITIVDSDSSLTKTSPERILKHIEDSIREIIEPFIGEFNAQQNHAALKEQFRNYLFKLTQDNLTLVDDYGHEITADSMQIEGNVITIPQPVALVPRWARHNTY